MARLIPAYAQASWDDAGHDIALLLRDRLDEHCTVFQMVAWQYADRKGRSVEGEIECVVVDPVRGIIVLSVQGGGVQHKAETGEWTTIDREGHPHSITDPIQRARQSRLALRDYLAAHPRTKSLAASLQMHKAVWFPDVEWSTPLPSIRAECLLDARDRTDPAVALGRVFASIASETPVMPLDPAALEAIEEAIAPNIAIESRLVAVIDGDKTRMSHLTIEQAQRLWLMRDQRRVLIAGDAGTGKTMLAYEVAWRMAANEQRTLLVNVTEFQSEWLLQKLAEHPYPAKSPLDRPIFDIHHIQSLGISLARQAGLQLQPITSLRLDRAEDQRQLARHMRASLGRLRQREQQSTIPPWEYDAILIDEAQDIERDLLLAIQELQCDPQEGYFFCFYDPAQRVDLPAAWDASSTGTYAQVTLTNNCRNSGAIFQVMQQLNPILRTRQFRGPQGSPVTYHDPRNFTRPGSTSDGAIQLALLNTLEHLIVDEGVAPVDILVITCRPSGASQWKSWRDVSPYPLRALFERQRAGAIRLSTIRSAKGLESDVVVLAEVDGVARDPQRDRLLYLAVSRARAKLVVIGSQEDLLPHGAVPSALP